MSFKITFTHVDKLSASVDNDGLNNKNKRLIYAESLQPLDKSLSAEILDFYPQACVTHYGLYREMMISVIANLNGICNFVKN